MPPKKKGDGGKKGKKSGKSKGEKQPQLTVREAVLAFQIEVRERDLVKITEEFQTLKDRNRRLRYRNEQLKKEQGEHIKTLLKQAKENEKEVEQMTVVKQEEVEKALADKIQIMKKLIAEQDENKEKIKQMVTQIEEMNQAIATRKEYKNNGQVEHGNQISLLKRKLADMESSFQEVSAHLDRSLRIAKEEIEQQGQSTLETQKKVASEEATNSIKKDDRQEIADHKWLKKEISIHVRAFEDMSVIVESLERENLEIMRELFDCKTEDLNLARRFYLACVNDQDESGDEEVFAQHNDDEVEHQDENLLENYLHFNDEDYLDSPRLGPMDLQLLSVVGTKMPLHESTNSHLQLIGQADEVNNQSLDKTESENDIWPISENMLRTFAIK
ncbi:coiled-coil domain-containing protein 83-like [Dendronephthya gigantea]|uniref:coiled-coil domain-containing protein 83-like n=1 Tax=Dendronephthya gigantea TaxID=151771 RepID=UPI001069C2F5|nr:coiled-coil domain-containing protein 83-like [Dendronephthya gigantea]